MQFCPYTMQKQHTQMQDGSASQPCYINANLVWFSLRTDLQISERLSKSVFDGLLLPFFLTGALMGWHNSHWAHFQFKKTWLDLEFKDWFFPLFNRASKNHAPFFSCEVNSTKPCPKVKRKSQASCCTYFQRRNFLHNESWAQRQRDLWKSQKEHCLGNDLSTSGAGLNKMVLPECIFHFCSVFPYMNNLLPCFTCHLTEQRCTVVLPRRAGCIWWCAFGTSPKF